MRSTSHSEIAVLREVSARLGRDPLLVQAASGNTSLKLNGVLWIKASGKWLARAGGEEMFVGVRLEEMRAGVALGLDPAKVGVKPGASLRPSVETAMHAVIPWRAVIHVHSINAIAWAVRNDGRDRCGERLTGLEWGWIPYVASGLPLAREVERCLDEAPFTRIFVLANHGLVVCGDTPCEAEELLWEVERRMAIQPRRASAPSIATLEEITGGSGWRLPERDMIHALATDPLSRRILQAGILYPCQAIFLGTRLSVWPMPMAPARETLYRLEAEPGYAVIEDCGVIVGKAMTPAGLEMLYGLAEVIQRIDGEAKLRYLTEAELSTVLSEDVHRYRGLVEQDGNRSRRASA